jgi:Family of unknown function (DUF5946)
MFEEKYHTLAYYTLGLKDNNFIHQHLVDVYTVQNANQNTKPISLTFALMGLYLLIEEGYTGRAIQKFHAKMSNDKQDWVLFPIPNYLGNITIDDVILAAEGEQRNLMLLNWCHSVWAAFKPHHKEISKIANYYL